MSIGTDQGMTHKDEDDEKVPSKQLLMELSAYVLHGAVRPCLEFHRSAGCKLAAKDIAHGCFTRYSALRRSHENVLQRSRLHRGYSQIARLHFKQIGPAHFSHS